MKPKPNFKTSRTNSTHLTIFFGWHSLMLSRPSNSMMEVEKKEKAHDEDLDVFMHETLAALQNLHDSQSILDNDNFEYFHSSQFYENHRAVVREISTILREHARRRGSQSLPVPPPSTAHRDQVSIHRNARRTRLCSIRLFPRFLITNTVVPLCTPSKNLFHPPPTTL